SSLVCSRLRMLRSAGMVLSGATRAASRLGCNLLLLGLLRLLESLAGQAPDVIEGAPDIVGSNLFVARYGDARSDLLRLPTEYFVGDALAFHRARGIAELLVRPLRHRRLAHIVVSGREGGGGIDVVAIRDPCSFRLFVVAAPGECLFPGLIARGAHRRE